MDEMNVHLLMRRFFCFDAAMVKDYVSEEVKVNFKKKGFVIFQKLFSENSLQFMKWYYQNLKKKGQAYYGSPECQDRYNILQDSVASNLLKQLEMLVTAVTGKKISRNYAHYIQYVPGAVLTPHVDNRVGLECTLDVALDSTPGYIWPIYMDNHEILLEPGDVLLYMGRLEHYRNVLPDGMEVSNLLLHYFDIESDQIKRHFEKFPEEKERIENLSYER